MVLKSWRVPLVLAGVLVGGALWPSAAAAQLDETCTVSILNRTAQVSSDGSWRIDNVPANFGPVRARATCVKDGVTRSGQSEYFVIRANSITGFDAEIELGFTDPIPESLVLAAPTTVLTPQQLTTQLVATARFPSGRTEDVTGVVGTSYTTSNAAVASIDAGGLITAGASGTALISALKDGALGILRITVRLTNDTDGDGLPDDLETANGLEPGDPTDALADPDNDGLTNSAELLQFGTDLRNRDTDGDTIADGEEAIAGGDGFLTNPLLGDSDGDGLRDALEIATGSDPNDAASFNLARALRSLSASPDVFVLTVNLVLGDASRQLTVTGQLMDDTTIDLTSTARGTSYNSDDFSICNFGEPDGRVFGGIDGSCTVTVSNAGFSARVSGRVRTFAPTALSFVDIPGFANNVDVSGEYAYVAAGATGLQVVSVSNRQSPRIVGAYDTEGNANDVVVAGGRAYVADGAAGLRIVDVSDPVNPASIGGLDTPGNAQDVVVRGNLAYVADGTAGLQIIDVSNPAAPRLVGTAATPGVAKGVDVVPDRGLALVAAGFSGLQVVNVADPSSPAIVGAVPINNSVDVVARGDEAFVADFSGGFTAVSTADPAAPFVFGQVDRNAGGLLMDVARAGDLVFGADVFFVNGVPIVYVGDRVNGPAVRGRLDFPNRDDNGTGIAVDASFVYLTAARTIQENGTVGTTRLYIGQYLAVEDTQGVAPTVRITAPAPDTTAIEGASLSVSAEARDDVAVVAVDFLVDGAVAATSTAAPYGASIVVPAGGTEFTLGARAIDLGGNVGTAEGVRVAVIPDPKTTAIGRVMDDAGGPVEGAAVRTNTGATATTAADGTFSIPGLPTVGGPISATAEIVRAGVRLRGRSALVAPVPAGDTNLDDIVVRRSSRVGYYDLDFDAGNPRQAAPILAAGLEAVDVGALGAADLSQYDILFVQNPDNSRFSTTFRNNLAKIHQFVADGGVLVVHDRNVSSAASVLPGAPGTILRDFGDDANINIVDDTTRVTNGPAGVLTNASLDGGTSSSHGYILATTIPAGAHGVLSRGDASRLVTYSYPFGAGSVVYSTIPLDYYLDGSGPTTVRANMVRYAANVLAYASDLR
jgi:hypothetical protein